MNNVKGSWKLPDLERWINTERIHSCKTGGRNSFNSVPRVTGEGTKTGISWMWPRDDALSDYEIMSVRFGMDKQNTKSDETALLATVQFIQSVPALESWSPPPPPPGVPLPLGDGFGEGAVPLPRNFLNFLHKNGVFWCTLEPGF